MSIKPKMSQNVFGIKQFQVYVNINYWQKIQISTVIHFDLNIQQINNIDFIFGIKSVHCKTIVKTIKYL